MKKLLPLFILLAAASTAMAQDSPSTVTLDSGVKVQTLKATTGASPTASNSVKVHYRGTLQNGTEFDSSYKRGEPISFPLGRVIPCWTQAVQTMHVGEKAKVFCPAKTAYGSRGAGSAIPPDSDLNFDIELLGIQ
ncbi:MAG: FKBP-type peptidyl-prolyl cis-trans isomerase [Janthinobacterium lividum]